MQMCYNYIGCESDTNVREAQNMKKTLRGKTYDTAEMAIVKKIAHGNFGDPAGYEETLYVSENGMYFLYTYGGEQSPYPTEKLVSMSKAKPQAWEEENA